MSWDEAQVLIKQVNTILDGIDIGSSGTPALPNNARISFVPEANITKDLGDIEEVFETAEENFLPLPTETIYAHVATVLNGNIFMISGNDVNQLYKYDGFSWSFVSEAPVHFYGGSVVTYNNEIHVLGGSSSGLTQHYKWNGSEWVSVSTLPYSFYQSTAVVYNNEIHILGSRTSGEEKKHYKWNGSSWTSVSTLPFQVWGGHSVVYNNEIHLIGSFYTGSYRTRHYKWNGSSWTSVSNMPFKPFCSAVINGEIHIMSGRNGNVSDADSLKHYKWNGSSWTSVSTTPYNFYNASEAVLNNHIYIMGGTNTGCRHCFYEFDGSIWKFVKNKYSSTQKIYVKRSSAITLNNELHIFGGEISGGYYSLPNDYGYEYSRLSTGMRKQHYKWDGHIWTKDIPLPSTDLNKPPKLVILNNEIHALGYNLHYKFTGTEWVSMSTLPYYFGNDGGGAAVVLNGEIHILGNYYSNKTAHYKWNGTSWTEVSTLPYDFQYGSAVVLNGEIHILGDGTQHYKWNGSSWVSVSTLPGSLNKANALVFEGEIHILYVSGQNGLHYVFRNNAWVKLPNLPYPFLAGVAVIYGDFIHILGGLGTAGKYEQMSKHYRIGKQITSIPAGQTLEGTIQVTRKTS